MLSGLLADICCRQTSDTSAVACAYAAMLLQGGYTVLEGCQFVQEYLQLCEQYPAPIRMVKGHVHKLVSAQSSGTNSAILICMSVTALRTN